MFTSMVVKKNQNKGHTNLKESINNKLKTKQETLICRVEIPARIPKDIGQEPSKEKQLQPPRSSFAGVTVLQREAALDICKGCLSNIG